MWTRPPWMWGQHSRSRCLRLTRCAKQCMPAAVIKLLFRKLSNVRFANPEKTPWNTQLSFDLQRHHPHVEVQEKCEQTGLRKGLCKQAFLQVWGLGMKLWKVVCVCSRYLGDVIACQWDETHIRNMVTVTQDQSLQIVAHVKCLKTCVSNSRAWNVKC